MPARMEIIGAEPLIIIDGGHNEGCAGALAACVMKHLKGRKIIAVCGMMADKDFDAYLKITAPYFDTFIAVKPLNQRSLDAEALAAAAKKYCKFSIAIENSANAFIKAKSLAGKDDVIIVCGSFYLAGELRKLMLKS
jgi:dihydrofolate synthase / folylpolyglutamate synthase